MKLFLLGSVPFLFLQVGGGGGGGTTHCLGCDDTSALPDIVDQQVAACVSYTTASLTNWTAGDCAESGDACTATPCNPELVLTHHQASAGNGVTISGIIGDIKFGPFKLAAGPDSEILRTGMELGCGQSSPYYIEITGHCEGGDGVELVFGWFTCTACTRQ